MSQGFTIASPPAAVPASAFAGDLDPTVLDRARHGDCAALESIYRQFERAVYTLARRICGCPERAADVLQNTFLRAFRCLHQFRGEAPFGHWLRSICTSEALMLLRAERRTDTLDDADLFAADTRPLEVLCQNDLEHALSLLPPLTRAVLWLYHVEGHTHAEIAAHCGKTVSFSKSQLNRAHQRLRELLAEPTAAPRISSTSGTADTSVRASAL